MPSIPALPRPGPRPGARTGFAGDAVPARQGRAAASADPGAVRGRDDRADGADDHRIRGPVGRARLCRRREPVVEGPVRGRAGAEVLCRQRATGGPPALRRRVVDRRRRPPGPDRARQAECRPERRPRGLPPRRQSRRRHRRNDPPVPLLPQHLPDEARDRRLDRGRPAHRRAAGDRRPRRHPARQRALPRQPMRCPSWRESTRCRPGSRRSRRSSPHRSAKHRIGSSGCSTARSSRRPHC